MYRFFASSVCLGAVLLLAFAGLAQDSQPSEAEPSEVREKRLEERERIREQVGLLEQAGRTDEAARSLVRLLALERDLLGRTHDDVVTTLEKLAELEESRDDFPAARARREEVSGIVREAHGPDHWKATDARLALRDLDLRAELTPEQRKELREAEDLTEKMVGLHRAGRSSSAISLATTVRETRKRLLGEEHPDHATSLNDLALLYQAIGAYARAEPLQRRAVEIRREALGEDHPEFATSLNNLGTLYQARGEFKKAEPLFRQALPIFERLMGADHPDYATALANLAVVLKSMGDLAAAEPLHREVLEIRRKTLGEKHQDYATSLDSLALLLMQTGDYAAAEPLFKEALEVRRSALGEGDLMFALSLNNLATLYQLVGELEAAEPLYRQAQGIIGKTLGEAHPYYAKGLNNLAMLYKAMGDLAAAEPLHRQVLEILKKTPGEAHPYYATALNNFALLEEAMGDYAAAEALYLRALQIFGKALGDDHAMCATALNNLGWLYARMEENAKAESCYRQALEIYRKRHLEGHPEYAKTLNNLAGLLRDRGELAAAEPLYRQALEIYGRVLGEGHSKSAKTLNNLALLHAARGEYGKAEALYRQGLAISREALGEDHPDRAAFLVNLALLHEAKGEFAAAEEVLRQALTIFRKQLDANFAVQSERQQFQATRLFRGILDFHLSLATRTDTPASEVYASMLLWKGAIFGRQAGARILREDPAVAGLFASLESAACRLATLCLSPPRPEQREAWRRQIGVLTARREELEKELSKKSEAYREARAEARLTPAALQQALPSGVLLVDFLAYDRAVPAVEGETGPPRRRTEPHLAAFLVASEGAIRRVELGPLEAVGAAIASWRASIPEGGGADAGRRLRELVWTPIEGHLAGADTVLVSPDGPLNRLPLAALPGREPGTYLMEETAVAVVPVPRLLPGALARVDLQAKEHGLLVVGDVDYGGDPGAAGEGAGSRSAAGARTVTSGRFGPLPATREEARAVGATFSKRHEEGRVVSLLRKEATETAFRREAGRHTWLHLATHGFFAPPEVPSMLSGGSGPGLPDSRTEVVGNHPGLLSGLALSGANTPPEIDGDDGILTALEVAALDLSHLEMAVLSACETGLGEVAGGEGVLGLQRAFQVAGARTTVTSLWSVPDRATRLLMDRFYGNLWERKMTKLQALREAQLWMLNEGTKSRDGVRGLGPLDAGAAVEGKSRLSPYYWAAWVLSGDWR